MTSQVIEPPQSTSIVEQLSETEQQHAQQSSFAASPSAGAGSPPKQASAPSSIKPLSDAKDVPADQIKKPSEVNRDDPNINVVELEPRSQTFKERVYGYARLIRGTVLGKPDVKEQGTQVLRGEQSIPLRRGSQASK